MSKLSEQEIQEIVDRVIEQIRRELRQTEARRSVYEDMTPKEIRERMTLGKNHGH